MPDRGVTRAAVRGGFALSLAFLLIGCAAAPPVELPAAVPAAPPAEAPTPALLDAHAALLRLEDRRDEDVATLRALAADPSPRVRSRAALALGRIGGATAPALLPGMLADGDTSVAATAAFALGLLGDSAHAPALADRMTEALAAGEVTVASEAAYSLGRLGGPVARDALVGLLGQSIEFALAPEVAGSALLAIWRIDPPVDPDVVAPWLTSGQAEVRWRAAYALARRPSPEAIPLLRPLLRDADHRVRAAALRGMSGSAAGEAGEALVSEIAALLADSSYEVSIGAARALGSFQYRAAASALTASLAGADRHLAMTAAESLGRLGAPGAVGAPELERLATTDAVPAALRATSVESLARIDATRAAVVATSLATSPEWRLRAAAARGLADGDPLARELVRDPDSRVANAALQALLDRAGDDVASLRPLLLEVLGSPDPIVRATSLGALARAPEPAYLPLVLDAYARARDDTQNDAALAAIDALAALTRPGLDPSRAFLARFPRPEDPLVRARAAARLDSAAVLRAWGAARPIETGWTDDDYRGLVDRAVAPGLREGVLPQAQIVTRGDTIQIRLFADEAPLTVENFLRLADAGYFDGQEWPRVVANFVVQGGDPRGDTSGGPGYSIRDEIGRRRYAAGMVGMALAGPDTGGSQFFITHSPQPHLDGGYTIFGAVTGGARVAETILPGDTIQSIRSIR